MTFVSMILAVLVISGLMIYRRNEQGPGQSAKPLGDDPSNLPAPTLDREFVAQHWREIGHMMSAGGAGLKSALIEADKLLDYVMQAKGFKGENMGDRLKQNGSQFSDLNGIWSAHKLRNRYAHEVHIDVVPREVETAVRQLGTGIKDLGVQL